jgi:hypothetical protein
VGEEGRRQPRRGPGPHHNGGPTARAPREGRNRCAAGGQQAGTRPRPPTWYPGPPGRPPDAVAAHGCPTAEDEGRIAEGRRRRPRRRRRWGDGRGGREAWRERRQRNGNGGTKGPTDHSASQSAEATALGPMEEMVVGSAAATAEAEMGAETGMGEDERMEAVTAASTMRVIAAATGAAAAGPPPRGGVGHGGG